jgi:hypothetical protein
MFARLCGGRFLPEPSNLVNPNEQTQQTRFSRPIVMLVSTARVGVFATGYIVIGRPFHNLAIVAVSAIGLWLVASGCGKTERPAPATVRGTVLFQGKPLAGGLIVFAPDRDKGATGQPLSATIGPDGGYTLTHEGSPVVLPGWYRVAIANPPTTFDDGTASPRFPAALRRPDQAGLNREIYPAQDNVLNFEIEVPE